MEQNDRVKFPVYLGNQIMSILHSKVIKVVTIFAGIVYDDVKETWVNLDWTKIPEDLKNDIKVTADFTEGLCLVLDLQYDNSGKKVGLQFLQTRCNESLNIICSNKKIHNEGMSKNHKGLF